MGSIELARVLFLKIHIDVHRKLTGGEWTCEVDGWMPRKLQ